MPVLQSYLTGLAVVHLAWFYFFTTGLLLRTTVSEQAVSFPIANLVITSVAGMAVSGFSLLALGFCHLLNLPSIMILLVSEAFLFWLLKGDNCFSWNFWQATWQRFTSAWSMPALFIYLVFLLLGLTTVVPPTFADSVFYHLPYAVDWANACRIYVDPFLRFPYYANNFLLFDSAFFVLKLGDYCNFLTWLCGLLTCLGVLGFFSPAKIDLSYKSFVGSRFQPHQFLVPLSVALSPLFLRFLSNSYVDVPIGLFILVPVLCAYRTSSQQSFERELVVTGAFCAGMKLTLIGHLPFFLISLVIASAGRLHRRRIALLSVLLIILSLPWYARNLTQTGDPTPPVFNFYFNRPNPVFTKAEAGLYTADTMTERRLSHLLLLPFKFFADPLSKNFREPRINALVLFLYAPILLLTAQFFWRNRWRWPPRVSYLSATVIYLALSWFFSSLGRYSLHWYPVLAAWVGVIVSYIYTGAEKLWNSRLSMWIARVAAVVFCCALMIPSPTHGSLGFYRDYYAAVFDLSRLGGNRQRYLEENLPGYLASEAVIQALGSGQKKQTRVLVMGTEPLHFYFRKNAKIVSVGDYFGPARYHDLFNELQYSEDCLPYLTRLDISAVIIPRSRAGGAWWANFYGKLGARLTRCGFKQYRCDEDNIAIFLRNDIKPSSRLYPVLQQSH